MKGGRLMTRNYGVVSSIALDPIEKKPFHDYMPGTKVLSFGTYGCNLKCDFCQNYSISQFGVPQDYRMLEGCMMSPEQVVDQVKKHAANDPTCIGIAFTYNEPTVWYEFILDVLPLVRRENLNAVLVTNGFIEEKPLLTILPMIDAMNIDLKAFNEAFYENICHGNLRSVMRTIELAVLNGVHVELTTLIIPGLNDSVSEMDAMCQWVAGLNPNITLHLSRYFPRFNRTTGETPIETLIALKKVAEGHLKRVVIGNV